MIFKMRDKTNQDTNLIHATVEHKRGSNKPKIAFGFVAKGLLLTGAFIMGLSPATNVFAQSTQNTLDKFPTVTHTITVNAGLGTSYSEAFDSYIKDLNTYADMMQKGKEMKLYNLNNLNAIGGVLTKLENTLNKGNLPPDESKLIDALEKAHESIYFDASWYGSELPQGTDIVRQGIEGQFSSVFNKLGVQNDEASEVSTTSVNFIVEDKRDLGEKVKEIVDSCIDCINPRFAEASLLEDKVIEAYNNKGDHSVDCIDEVKGKYFESTFDDVKTGDWFEDGVENSYQMKLMSGEGGKKFNPKGNLTIAQTIAIASRLHSIYNTGSLSAVPKTDVWYEGVVQYAKDNNIIKDNDFSKSDMNKPATRGQVAYILSGALPQSELESINNDLKFKDVSGKYADAINLLAKSGVVAGKSEGKFKPSDKVTRAEASVIISRLVKPSERVKVKDNTQNDNTSDGRVVYVAPRNTTGQQNVYDKAGSGLTPITVKHGRHTYLSNNQEEYDYVMKVVEDTLNFEGKTGKEYKESIDRFKKDEKFKKRMILLYSREGITDEDKVFELYKIAEACRSVKMHKGSAVGDYNSAYELMKYGKGDCTSSAMINLAVMDAMGYNAKAVASNTDNHEWAMVQIDGEWWHLPSSSLTKKDHYDKYEFVTVTDTFNNAK